MDLSFFPLTLEAVDGAQAESLCLFLAADERPLTGLAGIIDWRLSGRLSRLLKGGLVSGGAGEAILTPPGARLGFRKLFLFGVGPLAQPEERLVEHLGDALDKLAHAGARDVAMELPSRLRPEVGIRTLVDHLSGPGRALVFGPDPQKLVGALAQAASRASAPPPPRQFAPPPAEAPAAQPSTDAQASTDAQPAADVPPDPSRSPGSPQRYVPPPQRDDHVFRKKK